MAGLLGDYDEPQGLLGNLHRTMTSPLFLGGAALLTGNGFGGAMQGMQMGAGFEENRRRRALAAQERQSYEDLVSRPDMRANLPSGLGEILLAAGPERGLPLLAKFADPDRSLNIEMQRANLAKTKAETNALNQKDAMSGWLMGLLSSEEPGSAPSAPGAQSPGVSPQSLPQGGGVPRTGLLPVSDDLPGLWGNPASPNLPTLPQSPQPAFGFQNAQYLPVQDAQPSPDASAPSPPVSGNDDLVQTPMGAMTRNKARQIGAAMAMDPRYGVLGKEFFDAARTVGPGMNKPTINAIQEKQFNTVEQFSRLKSIEQSWKPEYQEIENRMGFAWNTLMDKFGATRKSLSRQQQQEIAAFHANKSEALNNLNQYIKEITGAAMTLPEAERIKRTMPNPGEGVFDGDSPTEFYAKLQANIRVSKMALARYNYLSKRGFPADVDAMSREISLDAMPKVIQNRTDELLKESLNKNPGLTPQDVAPIVRQRLRAEFGIDA